MTKKQPKPNKINKQSPDLREKILNKFKKIYPPLFDNEGMLNQKELEWLVKDFSTPQTEKYEFVWAGKQQSKKKAFTTSKATLRSDKDRSVDFDDTQNLIIEGDNLEVLKLLQKSYFNKVKCIYIDPPYNTGNDFIYPDNYSEDKQAYWEKSGVKQNGVKLDTNTDSSGRYHSNWLSMMYPRLLLARNLLKEDGVIFVSIDDNELHNLRKLMDEVFGEENFVEQIVVISNPRGSQASKQLANVHEYLVMYAKNVDELMIRGYVDEDSLLENYTLEDSKGKYRLLGLRQRGGAWRRQDRPNMYFPLYVNPKDGSVSIEKDNEHTIESLPLRPSGEESRWTWSKGKCKKDINILVGKKVNRNGNADFWDIFRKDYIMDEEGDYKASKPKSLWDEKELNYQIGRQEVKSLFKGIDLFDFPKPTALVKKQIDMFADEDIIILDFFAGSGTTAHAVMDLNKEDGGNRKFILVQIPEATDEKSEAYKAGYKTISDICIERVKRAGKKLTKKSKQQKLIDEENKIDSGFKVFKLSQSHFPENTFAPDPDKTDEENKKALEAYIKKATSQKGLFKDGVIDLVYEIALKDGFELTLEIEKVKDFDKNTVYKVSDSQKQALICVDDSLENKTIEQLEKHKDTRFICLHTSVNTTKKWNLQNILGSNLWLV